MEQKTDSIDLHFVCMCSGTYLYDQEKNGRKIYRCTECDNELIACTICELPKSIWADDGEICGNCGLRYLAGQLKLTKKQIAGINRWKVRV